MRIQPSKQRRQTRAWCTGAVLALAAASSHAKAIDSFFATTYGWFVSLIFYSVPLGDAQFPLIVDWLLVAALATALSGTVGLGNIAGVGAALAIGGPGATFWMIVVGMLGMASKFTECTLGVKYRTILAAFVYGVIVGGMPSIASVTSRVVPWMAYLYVGMSVVVIVLNIGQVPAAFGAIFDGAFSAEGVAGGFVGALIQGLVSLLDPFIDTVVICTMTALVITIAGLNGGPFPNPDGLTGVNLTAASFQATADWFRYPLALAVIMFTVSIFNIIGLYFLMPIVRNEYKAFMAKVESGEFKRFH